MPSRSPAQAKLMAIAAHTRGGYGGVPQSVGVEFHAADKAQGKYKYAGGSKKAHARKLGGLLRGNTQARSRGVNPHYPSGYAGPYTHHAPSDQTLTMQK